MFKLIQERTYSWPVVVEVPQDGGTWSRHKFFARFRLLSQERINELLTSRREIAEPADDEEEGKQASHQDLDLLREVLIGWDQVADAEGNPLEYSDEDKERLIGIPYVRVAMIKAFFGSLAGKQDRRKN